MIACPSAKWTTRPDPQDPRLPAMSTGERDGIVHECFAKRKYFLRTLFQSLPSVLLVFSQSTANAFIGALTGSFSKGSPKVDEPVAPRPFCHCLGLGRTGWRTSAIVHRVDRRPSTGRLRPKS
jgi:hypothetical protein